MTPDDKKVLRDTYANTKAIDVGLKAMINRMDKVEVKVEEVDNKADSAHNKFYILMCAFGLLLTFLGISKYL